MRKLILILTVLLVTALVLAGCGGPTAQKAEAPKYPTKAVEIIIPWDAGGATDVLFRALGNVFPKYAGNQQLIVKNVPGGGAAIGYTEAMKYKGDGYGIVAAASPMVSKMHMSSVKFDINTFAPVILIADNACMIMVPKDSPYKDLKDFLADAKKRPGEVTVGNGGSGGGTHLAALAFENFVGDVKFKHVPFQGGGPQITAVLGKHVDAVMVSAPEGVPQAHAGQLRILGVFGEKRLPKFPNVATAKEQGVDFKFTMWRGVLAPKDTPPEIVKQMHDIFKKTMEDATFKAKAEELSVDLKYLGVEDFGKFLKAEDQQYMNLIKKAKLGDRYK
ncbi:MAG: tripartite tricarboxylate transporter substrate binding protein [Sporomusaceae bacterium]|nr:tripartite tricarboxylate transporter substrate binding protein [Sporomusaceae bacterium]